MPETDCSAASFAACFCLRFCFFLLTTGGCPVVPASAGGFVAAGVVCFCGADREVLGAIVVIVGLDRLSHTRYKLQEKALFLEEVFIEGRNVS